MQEPKFKYKQRVRVRGGFFRGESGVVHSVMSSAPEYLVRLGPFYDGNWQWIHEDNLEPR